MDEGPIRSRDERHRVRRHSSTLTAILNEGYKASSMSASLIQLQHLGTHPLYTLDINKRGKE